MIFPTIQQKCSRVEFACFLANLLLVLLQPGPEPTRLYHMGHFWSRLSTRCLIPTSIFSMKSGPRCLRISWLSCAAFGIHVKAVIENNRNPIEQIIHFDMIYVLLITFCIIRPTHAKLASFNDCHNFASFVSIEFCLR